MFRKILIANRGEIALRVIRACRELGVRTVAVYSEADKDSLHVRFADEHVCIGPAPAARSYLNVQAIIAAAEITNAEAVHPGYGFLSENSAFAQVLEQCELVFIGPSSSAISLMGNKVAARETAARMKVPVTEGSRGALQSMTKARETADQLGYPVMLKSASGGGGRGIRIAYDEDELVRIFPTARAEAEAAFGDGDLYMEQYLLRPRHVEVQILADRHGNVIHLGERECSLQRRRQKLIEESPCPGLNEDMRQAMGRAAIACAKGCDYTGAGTVEFLVTDDGRFYFMEMNTRVQVEHPVTEMVTGVDVVKEQILIAAGEPLSVRQDDIHIRGAAIEARITAEDPEQGFAPRPGKISALHLPGGPGIRIDTHIYSEYEVPSYYDSLLAKVIAHGNTREEAIARLRRALEEIVVEGIPTNTAFQLELLATPVFQQGTTHTWYVDEYLASRNGKVKV